MHNNRVSMRPQMQFLMKRGPNGAVAMCTCTTMSWPSWVERLEERETQCNLNGWRETEYCIFLFGFMELQTYMV